jgi:hypothetical protein
MFGPTVFAMRLATLVVGVLTIAVTQRLGSMLFGRVGGWAAAAAISVFYWATHISHQALRGNFYILAAAVAVTAVLRAYRLNTLRAWVLGGIALGATFYTYFSSVTLIAYTLGVLLIIAWRDPARRKKIFALYATSAIVAIPMLAYLLTRSSEVVARPEGVARFGLADILSNTMLWLRAWFIQGESNGTFNLADRPILDVPSAILFALGWLALIAQRRLSWVALFFGWIVATCLPSILSDNAPHFLRADGMIMPIALLMGAGVLFLWNGARGVVARRVIACALLAVAGINTYRDFHLNWVRQAWTAQAFETFFADGSDHLKLNSQNGPIYYSPFPPDHPIMRWQTFAQSPRPVGTFVGDQCMTLSTQPSAYLSISAYEPNFARKLSTWADVVSADVIPPVQAGVNAFNIYYTQPNSQKLAPPSRNAQFENWLDLKIVDQPKQTVRAGDAVSITVLMHAQRAHEIQPTLFLHVYGDLTPYNGGKMWAQSDQLLCPSHPPHVWRDDEWTTQTFTLKLPPDLPVGEYHIALGMYVLPDAHRLKINSPATATNDYVVAREISVR